MGEELVVGFDLDMTLIDTRPGFAATLDALAAELGTTFPTAELVERLGPPLDLLLADHLPAEAVEPAVDRFRELYVDLAIPATEAMPGAHEALAAVRRHGGRSVLVTGKYTANAQRHVDHLGLAVDEIEGMVWGAGKGEVLSRHGAGLYVGDHVHDVEGARAAGIPSLSVLTGGCTREELESAGTDAVLDDLTDFPQWIDGHVLETRLARLDSRLTALGSLLVAFSGGADSAFLLARAAHVLGPDRVGAATGHSDSLPEEESAQARDFAEALGVRWLSPETHELDRAGYRENAGDRCFFCKAELLDVLVSLAAEHRLGHVATGTNADDGRAGFRPGIRAAAERGAATPLLDAGLTKDQIRHASRQMGLPTWDKPAAACLSSRVAFGLEITPARLSRVHRAEASVRALLPGARNVRVRDLGATARVEVDADLVPLVDERVLAACREAGFDEAEVDARGFRSGSMNELLEDPERYR